MLCRVNCYVLTGGRSSRMGRSKAEMYLERIAAAAAPVFERVIAVQRAGQEPASIETIFEEPHQGEAPAFGVVRALRHANARCFVLATDLPLLTTAFLRDLRDRFEKSKSPALVPRWRGEMQPLCGGYSPELLPAIERRLTEGKLDLRGILAEEAVVIDVSGEELTNVNTPEEAERLK
jgi:molybdenum cofactor guanylyltransferase